MLLILYARVTPKAGSSNFNIVNYGAKGDGQTDNSQAFVKAWNDLCAATQGAPTLLIPKGKSFMLQPVSFKGPCKTNNVNIELQGTLVAPKSVVAWKWANNNKGAWIDFSGINGLVIRGGGTFDGQGATWWAKYSDDSDRPSALRFHSCKNLALSATNHINSPRNHISISTCSDSSISNIHVTAPEESPNTDGIDISGSTNILIKDSTIRTGDDCIAINDGSSFINITGITCGPGHGISVGSLGRDRKFETVEEVHVRNCIFQGTTNGARIKTWQGGSGYARKITFEDIILDEAENPIIINQNYRAYQRNGLAEAVKVSEVTFRNFTGTSASEEAITLNCDPTVGCTGIILNKINIKYVSAGKRTRALCNNVRGSFSLCSPNVVCS
ncbi:probable polygalacturonase At3g15720 isoform X4 [Lotus japonicus]|uniref:probable polygalacturonase At3g15720 isoform X4 n=1 Tax=Lotus japonicus TaxID=34305 RepID=UPI002586D0EC|nr:probable polygalacturonase At3g15720 isoform X4 [Lotus japonicus]XP_057414868.1 probable polygalacturonase At3g15720 isoform X4 [Lotus japonicus]XP_057414877.1 probable polygalacturonase At3g15720 isoform X4 [Lotus japonicus]